MNSTCEESVETRYYISSLDADVERISIGVRAHWSIENQLHYILDMSFDEDRNRVRKDGGTENMAMVRHIVMNFLSQDKEIKAGIKNKRKISCNQL